MAGSREACRIDNEGGGAGLEPMGSVLHVLPAEGVWSKGELGQGVVVAHQAYGGGVADVADHLDAVARLADAETASGKDFLIAAGVEFGEALAEFELVAVDAEGAVGPLLALHGVGREAGRVDAQEVAHAGLAQLEVAGHAVVAHHVDHAFLHRAENPLQHVVEVDTDVGSHAATLVHIALPRGVVPLAARGDVGEVDVVDLVLGTFVHLLLEGGYAVVKAELEDGVGLVAGFLLHTHEFVDILRVEHEGFLADDVAAEAEAVADESIVRIVGGADREPLQGLGGTLLAGAETLELLLLGEEGALGERAVEAADAVEAVVGCNKVVACVGDGFDVARGDVARGTDKCEVCHVMLNIL